MSNQKIKNLLITRSHQKCNTDFAATCPKSEHYRDELSILLNSCVTLKTEQWMLVDDIVDGISCTRILLRNAKVHKMPAHKRNTVLGEIITQHIWTVVDIGWSERALPTEGHTLYIKGFLYEYERDNARNIGIQTITAFTAPERPS